MRRPTHIGQINPRDDRPKKLGGSPRVGFALDRSSLPLRAFDMRTNSPAAEIAASKCDHLLLVFLATRHSQSDVHMKLTLDQIKIDGGTQARSALNEAVVAEYAETILAGTDMPPVTVFHDGKAYWLADGFHRYHAHRKARATEIDADVRTGTKRDAILHSVGANAHHGLRRTNDDKRCAVQTLLKDSEWGKWSDREIARACGVSHTLVAGIRSNVTGNIASEDSARTFKTKHGTVAEMDVSRLQKGVRADAPGGGSGFQSAAGAPRAESAPAPLPADQLDGNATTTPPQDAQGGPIDRHPDHRSESIDAAHSQHEDDEYTGIDHQELLEELQAENVRLRALVQAAEATDLQAEAIKWRRCYDNAVRQQSEAMDAAARSEDREKKTKALLMRCGKAVGEEDPRKIPAKVAQLAQASKVAA